jgi:hypothetical protein
VRIQCFLKNFHFSNILWIVNNVKDKRQIFKSDKKQILLCLAKYSCAILKVTMCLVCDAYQASLGTGQLQFRRCVVPVSAGYRMYCASHYICDVFQFCDTRILAEKSGRTERTIKEATDTELHPSNVNREGGSLLKPWTNIRRFSLRTSDWLTPLNSTFSTLYLMASSLLRFFGWSPVQAPLPLFHALPNSKPHSFHPEDGGSMTHRTASLHGVRTQKTTTWN